MTSSQARSFRFFLPALVFAIEHELGVPVRFVGVGEQVGDLIPFDPEAFVAALFG